MQAVMQVQTQMQTGRNLYDAYINDSDLIGTHSRLQLAVNLSDWMAGDGKDVTNPMLDVDDFIGKSFTTGPDGKLYQLPDQQFANLPVVFALRDPVSRGILLAFVAVIAIARFF